MRLLKRGLVRSYFPESIKTILRRNLNAILPHKSENVKGISYHKVFGNELAPRLNSFDDVRRGWKHLTSYNVIKRILAETPNDKSMKQAEKLSLWLTFQMFRELFGVEK